jgi:peptide chain release factor 2
MQELRKQLEELQKKIVQAMQAIGIVDLVREHEELQQKSLDPSFWADATHAQSVTKKLAVLEKRIDLWQRLEKAADDILEMIAFGDLEMEQELQLQYAKLRKEYEEQAHELAYNGPHDQSNVIMDIYAGAGGTDAQDWASMLLRMYSRWAEAHDADVTIIAQSDGEEAGIKSVTLEIDGDLMYGKLKGEHGVHRLVRLSPFNSDSLRQTSFAKVVIMPKIDQPDEVAIDEKDLKIDVYRAGGHGGQSVNTTDSAVRITHIPTGITVAIQNERSQLQNKETAMTILRSRLASLMEEQHKEKVEELKGPNQSAEWGSQIRSYVLHPYKQVKDVRSKYETTDVQKVLDGELDPLIKAYQEASM